MNLKPILVFYARLTVVILLVECVTFWGWSRWFWTPIQAHYMGAYVWSSVPRILSVSGLRIHWIWKTAPGAKRELATEDDAVRVDSPKSDKTRMGLSQAAKDAGWTGLVEAGPEPIAFDKLKPVLSDQIFEGQSVWIFVLLPGLIGFGSTIFLIYGLIWIKDCLPEAPWRRRQSPWDDPVPNVFGSCAMSVKRIPSLIAPLRRVAIQPPVPSATDATDAETPALPTPAACPPFGAQGGLIAKVYRWSEKDEID